MLCLFEEISDSWHLLNRGSHSGREASSHISLIICLLIFSFSHRFWSMLGYLANTLIFVLVGIVISIRAFSGVTGKDWVFMFVLYCGIMVIRCA